MSLVIPKEYPLVILSGFAMYLTNTILGIRTIQYRKKHKVPHPTVYTNDGNSEFNRVQRGHMHFVENAPFAMSGLFLAGLYRPRVAAGLGLAWTTARFLYAKWYQQKKEKRVMGLVLVNTAEVGLWGIAVWNAVKGLISQ